MHRPSTDFVSDNELMRAPALFRFGPRLILFASCLVALATLLAGSHRQSENRKSEYEKALVTAAATSAAAVDAYGQFFDRLRQASTQVDALQAASQGRVDKSFARFGMGNAHVNSFAVTAQGDVLPLGTPSALALAKVPYIQRLIRQRYATGAGPEFVRVDDEPELPDAPVLAVVHKLAGPGSLRWSVHLVSSATMVRMAQRAMGTFSGEVRLGAKDEPFLFAAVKTDRGAYSISKEDSSARHTIVTSVPQALAQSLDFQSTRLIAAGAVHSSTMLTAQAGLLEAELLYEYKSRYYASWVIIGVALACFTGLSALVAWALYRFRRTESYLRGLATTDILTGLPNRRRFHTLLDEAVRTAQRSKAGLAMLLIDLDNFKDVNDTLGHAAGDELLRRVAESLQKVVRPNEQVCRLAGDEFTIIVPGAQTVEEAQAIGDRVVHDIRAVTNLSGSEVEIRASVGVALLPKHARNGEDLMRFADTALYRAKNEGRGRCTVYDPGMTATELARAQTVRELQAGIAADELFLVYQPKYHLATGTLTGYEALVRWLHPKRGIVFPNEFIGLAEQSGLIHDLGTWVLRRAVRQIRQWADDGRGWHSVAVNMSSLQLRDGQFVNVVTQALAEFHVPGRCLQIELTESCIAANKELARSLVKELRKLGASVAVDDFGTGYSSLSTLSEFDIDCLKVDRSFVNAIQSASGEAICRAVISLGHSLGMRIVAEGVETLAQSRALARLDCNEVQGYYFAKPQPVEKAITLLRVQPVLPQDEVHVQEAAGSVVVSLESKRTRVVA